MSLICRSRCRLQVPYALLENKAVYGQVLAGLRLQCPSGCPLAIYKLMEQCWTTEAADRLSFHHLHAQLSQLQKYDLDPPATALPQVAVTIGGQVVTSNADGTDMKGEVRREIVDKIGSDSVAAGSSLLAGPAVVVEMHHHSQSRIAGPRLSASPQPTSVRILNSVMRSNLAWHSLHIPLRFDLSPIPL